MAQAGRSFLKEWGGLIAFGLAAVALIVGFRFWTEHQANAPVKPELADYLARVAAESGEAKGYLERYFREFGRRTVASRHFETVCARVTVLADAEDARPERISEPIARACRRFAKKGL